MKPILKNYIFASCALAVTFCLQSCFGDEGVSFDVTNGITMNVSSETGVTFDLFDDKGEYPIECLIVKDEDFPKDWRHIGVEAIEGFSYKRGHEYVLNVNRTKLANPPADGSAYIYELNTIIEEKECKVYPKPSEIKIEKEDDIPFEENCPNNIYNALSKVILVDDNGNITDENGLSLGYYDKNAAICFKYAFSRENPERDTFLKAEYLINFAYVLSPSSDKIETVKASGASFLFCDFINKEQWQEIIDKYDSGETLEYEFILANFKGSGLQKISLTIQKK